MAGKKGKKAPQRKRAATKKALTPKQELFVAEYLKDFNGKQAAIRAGYSPKTAEVQASKLLSNPKVQERAQSGAEERAKACEVTVERVIHACAQAAFVDPRRMFDAAGNLLPIHQLPDDIASAIAGIEVVTKADGTTMLRTHKIKLIDPLRARELLGRYLSIWQDNLNVRENDYERLKEQIEAEERPPEPLPANVVDFDAKLKKAG